MKTKNKNKNKNKTFKTGMNSSKEFSKVSKNKQTTTVVAPRRFRSSFDEGNQTSFTKLYFNNFNNKYSTLTFVHFLLHACYYFAFFCVNRIEQSQRTKWSDIE